MGKLTPEQAAKNRERQRRWRERAFKDPDGHLLHRVNLALGSHAAASLRRLSNGYGLTHRELIERLLIAANAEIAETIGHEPRTAYYDERLEPGALGAFDLMVKRAPADADEKRPTPQQLIERAELHGLTLDALAERIGCTVSDLDTARSGGELASGYRWALVDMLAETVSAQVRALLSDADDAHGELDGGKSHDADTEIESGKATPDTAPAPLTLAPSRLSQAERERLVIEQHALGHGSRAIAKLTGIGESTARLILKRHGLANEQRVPMPD